MATRLTALQTLIESLVSDETDSAFVKSNKRRREFKRQFNEIDSLNIKQPQLNLEVDQPPPTPATTPAPVDPTAPPPPPAAPNPAGTPAAPAAGDPMAPATGVDPAIGGDLGAPGGDPNDPNAPTPEGGGDALGGGSGFGGFGGGGGGGGGGGDSAGAPENDAQGQEVVPEPSLEDPIQGMVDGAQELLNQTQDPALIFKSLKGQIQTLFKNPDHALGLVKALYDTNDTVLQSVAQRLWMFLKAESPKN